MATTDIDIASQGLGLCRGTPISSFDDGTNEADIAGQYYGTFIKDIFSRYPWSFALKKRQLSRDSTDPVNEWKYSFVVPAEVERLFAVYRSGQVGAKPMTQGWDRVGNFIFTNEPELWAEYTVYKPESQWPGYFIQYAIHAFALLIAVPYTDDKDLRNDLQVITYGRDTENERGGKFGVAASTDAQSKPAQEVQMPDLIAARFS